jgi:hypothetical protein
VVVDHAHGRGARRVLTRRAAVAGLVVVSLLVPVAVSALATPSGIDGVSAVEASTGHHLPADPMVRPGERVMINVTGFAPAAVVTVGFVGVRLIDSVAADDLGTVVYPYTVPRRLESGQHALAFSGASRAAPHRPPPGNVHATLPLTRQWPFRTAGTHEGPPSGAPGSHGVEGTGNGPPAFTGIDVAVLVIVGALALLLGIGLLWTGNGRRRRPR